jgi:hypothetical protein
MQDVHLLEKLARFDQERIPGVSSAKGGGLPVYFAITADVTKYLGQVLPPSESGPESSSVSPLSAEKRARPMRSGIPAGSP